MSCPPETDRRSGLRREEHCHRSERRSASNVSSFGITKLGTYAAISSFEFSTTQITV